MISAHPHKQDLMLRSQKFQRTFFRDKTLPEQFYPGNVIERRQGAIRAAI